MKKSNRNLLIIISIIFIMIVFCRCTLLSEKTEVTCYIDPKDISDSLFPITIYDNEDKFITFEEELTKSCVDSMPIDPYLDILFTYRESLLIPIYYKIIQSPQYHPYFKSLAIYVIGEVGCADDFKTLVSIFNSEKNDLVREFLASAIGKVANTSHGAMLTTMLDNEKNYYVKKTLEAAIERTLTRRRAKFTYLPLLEKKQYCRIKTFPSDKPHRDFTLRSKKKIDSSISSPIPMARKCMYPHMQYK